jgi:glycosyltransferase involved in cell wall biosynthesis
MVSARQKVRNAIAGNAAIVLIACAAGGGSAQVIDFSQIGAFESMASGTQRGGAPPKIIIDDKDGHIVFFTVLESNTDAKVYWTSLDGQPSTSIISGAGAQIFQIQGEFRLETIGGEERNVRYAYRLFRLREP